MEIDKVGSLLYLVRLLTIFIIISAATKTFSQIIAEGIGLGDKPDYVSVKALTTLIKKDTAVYMVKMKTAFLLIKAYFSSFFFIMIDVSRRKM